MKITAKFKEVKDIQADILALGLFEDDKTLNHFQEEINRALDGAITDYVLAQEGFEPKFGESYLFHTCGKLGAKKLLIFGLGKKEEFNLNKMRELGAKLYKACSGTINNKLVATEVFGVYSCDAARALYDGLLIASYNFDKYKSKKTPQKIESIEVLLNSPSLEGECVKALEVSEIVCNSLEFVKNLVNEPADVATPERVAGVARELAAEFKLLKTTVYDLSDMEKMGFGAFLAVAKGSAREPKFVHIKYAPQNAAKKIAIVGKGITFDSGGLNIKPAASMMNMKTDMSGSACVLGVARAVAQLEPNVEVHILTALCENMPGCQAYKLGDVLTAKNGKTIELDNTDAEGRLTLADVLCYADELGVDEIIDVATLTGACIVALGNNISGIMGKNQEMVEKLIQTGKKVGENLWQLPMCDDMQESLKSDIADMRNTGSRGAGSSTAAVFLSNFVKNKNWTHIDIAGTAFIDKPYRELSKGATGVMVRTLVEYIMSL